MLPADDAASLALFYHMNSEPWLNLEAYAEAAPDATRRYGKDLGGQVQLPRATSESPLVQALRSRRSCRSFETRQMPMADLALVLENAYGVTGYVEAPGGLLAYARPVPSAGALYPLEIYAATQCVDELADGVYRYDVIDHAFEPLSPEPLIRQLSGLLLGQDFLGTANAILFLVAVFDRTLRKYGPRGYRYMLLEAGHVAQNVCLLATQRQLGTLCLGGYYDARLNRHLGLQDRTEAVLYAIALGYPQAAL